MLPVWYVAPAMVLAYVVVSIVKRGHLRNPARVALFFVALNALLVSLGVLWYVGLGQETPWVFTITGVAMLVHPLLLVYFARFLQRPPRWAMPAVVLSVIGAIVDFGVRESGLLAVGPWVFVAFTVLPYGVAVAAVSKVPRGLQGPAATRQMWGALAVGGIALVTIMAALRRAGLVSEDALPVMELGGLLLAVGTWLALVPPHGIAEVWRRAGIESVRLTLPGNRPDMDRAALLDEAVTSAAALFLPGELQWTSDADDATQHWSGPAAREKVAGAVEIWRTPVLPGGPSMQVVFRSPRVLPDEDRQLLEGLASVLALRLQAHSFLHQQKRELQQVSAADRVKSEFLRVVAHELGNPLSPIRLQTAILRRRLPPEDAARLEVIERNADRLGRLIQNMKDVAALADGRLLVTHDAVDLERLVREAATAMAPVVEQAGLEMHLDLEPCTVEGDASRLDQVIGNLLSNAIKYTPQGSIHVRLRQGEEVILTVHDTGLGLTDEQVQQIGALYARFHQDEGVKGTGLGVHVAKALLAAHGGRLEYSSAGPNKGTTATVRLPLKAKP